MRCILLVWLAFESLSTLSAATELCLPDKEASINILAGSERNSTGHWLVSASSERTQQRGSTRRFEMDVYQSTRSCNNTEIIQLTITATINPPEGSAPDRREPATDMISTTVAPIEPGYIQFKGYGWYKMHTAPDFANWTAARETCQREGGDLLVFDTEDELKEVYPELYSQIKTRLPLVGVYDPGHNGTWVTVHGESVPSYWWQEDPGSRGFCAMINHSGYIYKFVCDFAASYICEIREQ